MRRAQARHTLEHYKSPQPSVGILIDAGLSSLLRMDRESRMLPAGSY
jgi:hypothetical protein